MPTLTVTAKGQVTFRKDVLEHLGVAPGDQISVEKLSDGRIEVRAVPGGPIAAVFGMLKDKTTRKLSVDEISAAAREGWSGKAARK